MITQLKRRERLDHLTTERRLRRGSKGRWVYLGLLAALALWLADLAVGDLFFFRAEGFVLRAKQLAAAPFTGRISALHVSNGNSVAAGEPLAELSSPSYARDIAQLSLRIADLEIRVTEFKSRAKVLEGILPLAERRAAKARGTISLLESDQAKSLVTSQRISNATKEDFEATQELRKISAEHETVTSRLQQVETALARAREALSSAETLYAGGIVAAMQAGTIVEVHASPGSVVKEGDPIVEFLSGPSYVLAYTNPGALYRVEVGEPVLVTYGLRSLSGSIESVLPVSGDLPAEFQRAFRPKERAQMIRIRLAPGEDPPPLLTKVQATTTRSPRAQLVRLIDAVFD